MMTAARFLELESGATPVDDVERKQFDECQRWKRRSDAAKRAVITKRAKYDRWPTRLRTRLMQAISVKQAVEFVRESNGKFFSIKFIKRTTGELREMVCRTGVKRDLAEEPKRPGLNFKDYGLLPVFDTQKDAYRSIPIEGIQEIKIDGVWYKVDTTIYEAMKVVRLEMLDSVLKFLRVNEFPPSRINDLLEHLRKDNFLNVEEHKEYLNGIRCHHD